MNSVLFRSSSVIALCSVLAACGGGSVPTPAPAPTIPDTPTGTTTPGQPASTYRTTEYNVDHSLGAIKAAEAYSKGFTGEGAVLGFVDYNFEFNNDEVNWSDASVDRGLQWVTMYLDYLGAKEIIDHHGHWVASIAAAKKNDYAMHGVAFNAEVIAVDFFSGVNMHTEVFNGVTYYVADPYTYLYDQGARVISKSFGYDETDFIANPPARSGNEHYVNTDAATFIALGGLVVAAAGNGDKHSSFFGDPEPMVSNLETLEEAINANWYGEEGFFIIAGSVDANNVISSFSDRAGSIGAPRPIEIGGGTYNFDPSVYYMVAPGEDVAVNWNGSSDGIGFGDGTSFSAPHISGAAALLFGRWPQLSARDVGAILLNSATDLGAPGVDNIYGHGMLNVDAATEPLGSVSMVISGVTAVTSTIGSMMSLGDAFGDATPSSLSEVMLLDSYNRDFYMDMSHQVLKADPRLNLANVVDIGLQVGGGMARLGGGYSMGFTTRRSDISSELALSLSSSQEIEARDKVESWHLRGSFGDKGSWAVGSGASLSDVMTSFNSNVTPDNHFYLTGRKTSGPQGGESFYFASETMLDKGLYFGIGFKSAKLEGQQNNPLTLYQDDLPNWEMEARLSKAYTKGSLSFALGALVEKGAILGSRSSGGFKLADQTRTFRANIFADYDVSDTFTVTAQAQVGMSAVDGAEGSLFAGVNDFISSSWSLELSGANILTRDDAFGFKISQPLRVENAKIIVQGASHFDYSLKAPVFENRTVSFSPSSREIAAEIGYKKSFGRWMVETNLAQRFNAGHIEGLHDTVGLLRIARGF